MQKTMLDSLWNDIPEGRENAISRGKLKAIWEVDDRTVRRNIARLRAWDNGDDYIIVSHSRGGATGYYKTKNAHEIRRFERETAKRIRETAKVLPKVRRILKKTDNERQYGEGLA